MKHTRKAVAVLLSLALTAGVPALAAETAPAASADLTSSLTVFPALPTRMRWQR